MQHCDCGEIFKLVDFANAINTSLQDITNTVLNSLMISINEDSGLTTHTTVLVDLCFKSINEVIANMIDGLLILRQCMGRECSEEFNEAREKLVELRQALRKQRREFHQIEKDVQNPTPESIHILAAFVTAQLKFSKEITNLPILGFTNLRKCCEGHD